MIKEEPSPFKDGMPPIHPGEFLSEDLEEFAMSAADFDTALAIPAGTTASLVAERCRVTPELALRLSYCICTTAELWMNLQASYDLKTAERKYGAAVAAQVTPLPGVSDNPYRKFDDGDGEIASQ